MYKTGQGNATHSVCGFRSAQGSAGSAVYSCRLTVLFIFHLAFFFTTFAPGRFFFKVGGACGSFPKAFIGFSLATSGLLMFGLIMLSFSDDFAMWYPHKSQACVTYLPPLPPSLKRTWHTSPRYISLPSSNFLHFWFHTRSFIIFPATIPLHYFPGLATRLGEKPCLVQTIPQQSRTVSSSPRSSLPAPP